MGEINLKEGAYRTTIVNLSLYENGLLDLQMLIGMLIDQLVRKEAAYILLH